MRKIPAILLLFLCLACSAGPREHRVTVLESYPHDRAAYTQGLYFQNDTLYETTGQYGESSLRKVDLATGGVLKKINFSRKYFAEGSCVLDGKLYVLTWTSKVAFVYNAESFTYESTWSYPREGWGLTTDGEFLYASDGSNKIYVLDSEFKLKRTIFVSIDGRPLRYLNELEWVDGRIWANVYTTDMIVVIDPDDGKVTDKIDCTGLLPKNLRNRDTDVLNGIAVNSKGEIFLTGKNWPKLYKVKISKK